MTRFGRRVFPLLVIGSLFALAGACLFTSGGCVLERLCPPPPDEVSIEDMLLDELEDLLDVINDRIDDLLGG